MGLLPYSKPKLISSMEIEEIVNKNNPQLEDYFSKIKHNDNGAIDVEIFHLMTFLKLDMAKHILNLCCSNNRMYLIDLKYFYTMIVSPKVEHKLIFISLLLFSSKEEISTKDYINNCLIYLYYFPYYSILTDSAFIESIKKYQGILGRVEFTKMFPVENLNDFCFLKKEVEARTKRLPIKNELSYYCNCAKHTFSMKNERRDQPSQIYQQKIMTQEMRVYDQMRPAFQSIEKQNGGIFPLHEFDRILKEIQLHPLLTTAISDYLKRQLMNSFLYFEKFRDFLLLFTKKGEDKTNLLFQLLAYPNKEIQMADFKEYIPKNIKLESITKEKFIELSQELPEFKELLSTMDKVNAIPLLYFNLHPKDISEKRIALEVAMNGLSFENYLAIHIILENEFYCIDAEFVHQLENCEQNNHYNSFMSILHFSHLFDEHQILKRELIYKKDFYIVTKKIFNLLTRWFEVKGKYFPLKRIEYNDESRKEMIDLLYYPTGHNISQINNGIVYEIELYPLYIQLCSFEILYKKYKNITMEMMMYTLNEIVNHSIVYEKKTTRYSRKNKISDFKTLVRLNGKDNVDFNIWIYYNNTLYCPDINHDFEEEKIVNSCLIILDPKVGNRYYYDIINNTPEQLNQSLITNNDERKKENDNQITIIDSKGDKSKKKNEDNNNNMTQSTSKFMQCSPLGVGNIGNSCYLSSVLQIIINLPILKEVLLLPQIPYFINKRNKNSNNGIFVLELINIFKSRWTIDNDKDIRIINPKQLKIIAGKIHPRFNNFEQQDAHEFLTFLLDECNEEINLKSEKIYIQNPELENQTIEELSNISWANHIRRSASFIDALFLFQLKSNLTCTECNTAKISFETSSNLFLPIPLFPTIHLKIVLFRLPFEYKVYYDIINTKFHDFLIELANKGCEDSLEKILKSLYIEIEDNEELRILSTPIKFEIEVERNWLIEEMINRIKQMHFLQLEPVNRKRIEDNTDIIIDEIYETTYLAIKTNSDKFINHKLKIDACFQDAQTLKIYELLNTNGLQKLRQQAHDIISSFSNQSTLKYNLRQHQVKCSLKKYETVYHQSSHKDTIINSINNRIAYYSEDLFNTENIKRQKQTEYILPIYHCYQQSKINYLFYKTTHTAIQFPEDYLIVNNSKQNITARHLYDYIWAKYKRFIKESNKIQSQLWWNSIDSEQPICYPFNLKWSKQFLNHKNLFVCSQCLYYHFCSGCIIDPFSKDNLFFDSESIILVVWCSKAYENELLLNILNTCIVKTDLIDESHNEDKENTIDDCLNLFFEKEKLDVKLKCDQCKSMQSFTKNYQLDKAPYILVVSLNRFKYATMYNKKISTMIKFPLYDFKQGNEVYDLYGVINHYGSMNSGHYIAIVKDCNQWIGFDDARFYEVLETKVVSKEAYILVYIAKSDINDWNYYKMLKSIILDMVNNKEQKTTFQPEWTFGQPVKTSFGNGYFVRKNENWIEIQLNDSGLHLFKESEVIKETVLNITNEGEMIINENKYEDTIIQTPKTPTMKNDFRKDNNNTSSNDNDNNREVTRDNDNTRRNYYNNDGEYQCVIM